ncbi:MAG: hypothetical protein WD875_17040 [Pirellulales bacterium]
MRCVALALLLPFSITTIVAAAPSIGNVTPPALQVGATATIRIDGGDLAANPRVLLPVKIVAQTVKPGGSANTVEIDVKLDAAVEGGIYLARVATDSGVSNVFPIAIDSLPTVPVPTNLTQMPVALFGDLTGGNVVRTTFVGQKDQPMLVEVEARRLGGKLKPVLRLLDERGVQVAWSEGERRLGGDARFSAKLPAAGTYTIELNDLLFRGEGPGRFRLKIGQWDHADLALPIGIQRGTVGNIALVGGNIFQPSIIDARLFAAGIRAAPWPAGLSGSGTRPALVVSEHPELAEHEDAGYVSATQQLAAAPIAVSGRLSAKGERDHYAVPVTPGETLRLELLAERVGSPIDGVLIVRNTQGGELARGDDQSGTTDPGVNFKVPDGVTSILVDVEDLLGRGGRDFVYRLSIVPANQQSFSLAISQDAIAAPVGGRILLRVAASRAGYDGPIRLSLAGSPQGVAMSGGEIPQGIDTGLVTIGGGQPAAALVSLVGNATIDGATLVRVAQAPDFAAAETQPWFREELAVSASGVSPLAADWTTADEPIGLSVGGKLAVAVKIARGDGVAGPVRLSLITSQTVPKKKVDNKEVDDPDKALRAEAVVVVPPEANEGAISILAPAELARLAYDVVVQAELLSADGKQVVATTYTTPRRTSIVDAPPP